MSESDERHIEELNRVNLREVEGLTGLARRGPHTKHHGCVSATFHVRGDIPEDLRQGLFGQAGEYRALVRFSNAVQDDDSRSDVHGMAIKVLDVDGPKLLEGREQERAQDFLLIDTETFPTGDPVVYTLVNRLQKRQGRAARLTSLARLIFFHLPVLFRLRRSKSKPSSPLTSWYFSTTPYALGPKRVKYVARPLEPGDGGAGVDSPHGLSDALVKTLEAGEVVFEFGVDIQTDRASQPIERPHISWSKAGAQREWLARLVIHRQTVDPAAALAENLMFSPWHALAAHEPLGYINRARRPIYADLARYRHDENRIVPRQSSEAPASYNHLRPPDFGDLYWGPPKPHGLLGRLRTKLGDKFSELADRYPGLLPRLEKIPWLRPRVNRSIVNRYAGMTAQRPLPLSLWTPDVPPVGPNSPGSFGTQVSWPGLVDRSYTGRLLPPCGEAEAAALPDIDKVTALFARKRENESEIFKPSKESSALLCFFAQWLSDSFLRTDPNDRRRNTSNHELDLCQLYGLGQGTTSRLREGKGGRLKSRTTEKGEFPPFLVDHSGAVKEEFADICFDPVLAACFNHQHPPHGSARHLYTMIYKNVGPWAVERERWHALYAGGLERANSTLFYSAFNTLFLREHNRIAGKLEERFCTGDDNWLFETARNINIVKYLKILIEDYLYHLSGRAFKLRVEPGFADRCLWYRMNRISLEFNLLYRWHSLVPDKFWVADPDVPNGKQTLENQEFRFNNPLVEHYGIERLFDSASRQPAGLVGLHNTPAFLLGAEKNSMLLARQFRLAPFNKYRRRWRLDPYTSFAELTGGDGPLAEELSLLYPDRGGVRGIDRVEFLVGLFAEAPRKNKVLPTLLGRMVASDAFSHALTNPLLAAYVFDESALTDYGASELDRVGSLADIVNANRATGTKPLTSFAWSAEG